MSKKLNIVFMGTPEFALCALKALYEYGHNILAVYCQPPREKGRGKKVQKNPTHLFAEEKNIPVFTPLSFKNSQDVSDFENLKPDVSVVAAYGMLLPKKILDIPNYGCINIHASLLPRWRGAAPIQRAIMAGDNVTGITTMKMDEGLDTGDIIEMEETPIHANHNSADLFHQLSYLGAKLILSTLNGLQNKILMPTKQPSSDVTYAKKLEKHEGSLDFNNSADSLHNKIRGLIPHISVWFIAKSVRFKILKTRSSEKEFSVNVGELVKSDDLQLFIQCSKGSLILETVQPDGGKTQDVTSFLRGYSSFL